MCAAGEGLRQTLQALFPQLPPENILNLKEADIVLEVRQKNKAPHKKGNVGHERDLKGV